MSLRARLAAFIVVAVGMAVGVVAFFAYGFASDEARGEVDDFLRERGPVVGLFGALDLDEFRNRPERIGAQRGGAAADPAPTQSPTITPFGDVIREDAIAQFIEANGVIVTLGQSAVILPVDEHDVGIAAAGGADRLRDVDIAGVHYRMLTRPLGHGAAIQVARDVTATDQILSGLRLRLSLLGLGGVALAAVVAWLIAGRSLRPVALLTEAAEHVAATRQLEARIEVDRDDELGRLGDAFNGMLAALEEARLSQQRLVADASHELRTPLTSVRTNIELLAAGAVEGDDRAGLLADLISEVGELSHLVSELVDLATIGRDEEPRVELDLGAVVNQAIERLERRTGLEIEADVEPTIITGRRGSLLRSVSNLLENAAKWGSGGDRIEIRLRNHELSIRDHGPGIPDADLDHVFDRFYRSPQARSQPGSGLGLSIVAEVTLDHGGEVFARNAADGGAIVGFTLPTSEE